LVLVVSCSSGVAGGSWAPSRGPPSTPWRPSLTPPGSRCCSLLVGCSWPWHGRAPLS